MKLNEIKLMESEFLTDEDEIFQWITDNFNSPTIKVKRSSLEIKNGVVNSTMKISLRLRTRIQQLSVKFGTIEGAFETAVDTLASFKGFPVNVTGVQDGSVTGYMRCGGKKIPSLEGITQKADTIIISKTGIKSLHNIHKHILECRTIFVPNFTSHGLSLLLIKNINRLAITNDYYDHPSYRAIEIIKKYLGKGKAGVLAAQTELEDAGLEDFAQL